MSVRRVLMEVQLFSVSSFMHESRETLMDDLRHITLCALGQRPSEIPELEAWIERWQASCYSCRKLSDNSLIEIYDVVAPEAVLRTIPQNIRERSASFHS